MDPGPLLAASAVCARALRAQTTPPARELCFSAGGLLAAGEAPALRRGLEALLAREEPLERAVDSEALLAWACARFALATENLAWAGLVLPRLERGLARYDALAREGFLVQPDRSDWKDSVGVFTRTAFFTQLLRWKAVDALASLCAALGRARAAEHWRSRARALARAAQRAYWRPEEGFFADALDRPRMSSDGNLAAIVWGFADEAQGARILRALDKRGLLTPWGPRAGERYPRWCKGWRAQLAGVPGYHDDCVWLWQSALELRALRRLGRHARLESLAAALGELLGRGPAPAALRAEDGRPVRSRLLGAGGASFWSAGMLLEAFAELLSGGAPAAEPAGEAA